MSSLQPRTRGSGISARGDATIADAIDAEQHVAPSADRLTNGPVDRLELARKNAPIDMVANPVAVLSPRPPTRRFFHPGRYQ